MKRNILVFILCVLMISSCFVSCGQEETSQSGTSIVYTDDYQLSDRQKNLLEAMGMPTEFSELDKAEKHTIQRIEQMLCYLEKKYDKEFIYYAYDDPAYLASEKLWAYAKDEGRSNTVTVRVDKDGSFLDDYEGIGVVAYAEKKVNNYVREYFDSNQFFHSFIGTNGTPHKEGIKKVRNDNFKWEVGTQGLMVINASICTPDEFLEFAKDFRNQMREWHMCCGMRFILVENINDIYDIFDIPDDALYKNSQTPWIHHALDKRIADIDIMVGKDEDFINDCYNDIMYTVDDNDQLIGKKH